MPVPLTSLGLSSAGPAAAPVPASIGPARPPSPYPGTRSIYANDLVHLQGEAPARIGQAIVGGFARVALLYRVTIVPGQGREHSLSR